MFDFTGIRGFIFDCDGTLLDTLGAWEEVEAPLFAEAGDLTDDEQDEIHAVPFRECASIFHDRYGVGESTEAVWNYLEGYLMDFYAHQSEPLPGAVDFVRAVHAAGVPCVVLSSSPRRYLEAGLQRAGILDCFCELISTEDVNLSKQSPEIYQLACDILHAQPKDIWAVDDAAYAVKVMGTAGFNTIAPVNGRGEDVERKVAEAATVVVDTLEDLLG